MIAHVEIRHRTYHDSVRLMQASAAVQRVAGVESALVAMATDLNLALLASHR
jgi:FdrA protein